MSKNRPNILDIASPSKTGAFTRLTKIETVGRQAGQRVTRKTAKKSKIKGRSYRTD